MDFDTAFQLLMRVFWTGVFLILCLGIWVGILGGSMLLSGWFSP